MIPDNLALQLRPRYFGATLASTLIASGLTVREAAARLKVGKTALYKALEGAAAKAKA